ncbi:MAG: DUF2219 family protein [Bacteroidia bacterium]|nr:DUF2219 family protein [Bacteroidia bacterium]
MKVCTSWVFLCIFLCMGKCLGQRSGISYFFDNDLLFITENEDRDYTLGMGVNFYHSQENKSMAGAIHRHLDGILGWESLLLNASIHTYSTSLELRLFTPDDLQASEPIRIDRPYASILTLGSSRNSQFIEKGLRIKSQFEIGLLGFFAAKQVQSAAHAMVRSLRQREDPYEPQGWQNQISRGGEFTFRYSIGVEQKIGMLSWKSRKRQGVKHLESTLFSELSLGYRSYLGSGLKLKLGWIPNKASDKTGIYLHSSLAGELVGYNALLQGQFRYSVHRLSYKSLNNWLYRASVGLCYQGKDWELDYSLFLRNAEFAPTDHPIHYWGALKLSFWR